MTNAFRLFILASFLIAGLLVAISRAQTPNRTTCIGGIVADGAFQVDCKLDGKLALTAKTWLPDPSVMVAGFHAPPAGTPGARPDGTYADLWTLPTESFDLIAQKRGGEVIVNVSYNLQIPPRCPYIFPVNSTVFPAAAKP